MTTRARSRLVPSPCPIDLGTYWYYWASRQKWYQIGTAQLVGELRDYTYTERCYDELHSGPPWKSGGPFNKWSASDGGFGVQNDGTHPAVNSAYKYIGGFCCGADPDALSGMTNTKAWGDPDGPGSDFGDVSSWGATAWNRFRPGRPSAELGVALGEIHEVPRMLMTTAKLFHNKWKSMGGFRRTFGPRNVANHWLNTQFGWLPFVRDCIDFYETFKSQEAQLQQLIKDNGQWILRKGVVHRESDVELVEDVDNNTYHVPIPTSYYFPDTSYLGWRKVYKYTDQHVWFSGRFRYYIPDIGSVRWRRRAIAKMYGLNISPSLLWELTPWSWLIDWFSNAGDVIANFCNQNAENLVAKYAYIMGQTTMKYRVVSHLAINQPLTNSWDYAFMRKTREKASPFGFGLKGSDLSPFQLSILAALGITRMF